MEREQKKILPGFEDFVESAPSKEKNTPKGYIKISPSSLELVDSDFEELVTEAEVRGAIHGYIGHALDNHIVEQVREARKRNDFSQLYGLKRKTKTWLQDWKDNHKFYKSSKSKKRADTEGSVFGAKSVEKIWSGAEDFEEAVINAHERRFNSFRMSKSEKGIPLLLETDPNLKVLIEEPAMYHVDFDFAKFQINMRYDYLIRDSQNDKVIIVDAKFGNKFNYNPDVETPAFFYSMLARYHLENREKFGKRKIRNFYSDTKGVEFWYRVLDRQKQKFHYVSTQVSQGITGEMTKAFFDKLFDYSENFSAIQRFKKMRKSQFVMPHISKSNENKPKQTRLIYMSD